MSLKWASKAPDEVVFREISWIGPLNGDVIDTSDLSIVNGSILLSDVTTGLDTINVTVSGGRDGELNILKNVITTGDGRTLEEIVLLEVADLTKSDIANFPSTASKKTILDMAFEQAQLAGYTFDTTPEERFSALRNLDGMMRAWETESISLNYNFPPVFGEGDENDASGIPDFAVATAAMALAIRIAPGIGKTLSTEARANLVQGMNQLRTATAVIPDRKLGRHTPRGAGAKPWSTWSPYFLRGE